ncbi:NlpC/P60 family protein [Blautia obeum]|uniref:Probable peptidoglycan endopeptidase LytE n=1 Tax=Blautia obeum TaxID=40520 RepID=A0A174PGY5_9FIRM|nr:NlpC/P60 family protein [Blautia obeum]CUP60272.1 Probable peptidoglycan endopeptidase LytE precursor [Blautia obeum]
MKKKHVLILFTVLALSVTSVMKLVPVSKVAASSILGGNNESILDKLTPTPEPGKSDKNEKDDSNVLGEKDSLSTNMTDSLTDLMNNLLSRVGDEEYSLLTKVLSQTDDDLIEDDSDTDDGDKDKEEKASISRVVYIGDSRTEGLRDVNSDSKNTFICLSSMGYDWMMSTAFPQAESYASSGTAFVILMGVNDLYHQNSYISAINQKAAEWKKKGAVVYFASVGPVQNDPYTSNSEIESFNRALKNGLSSDVGYIDLYGELNKSGYQTVDGTHYTNAVSKNIISFIGQQVALGGSGNSDPYATDGNKVWWCRNNKEMALLEYKVSDWTKFSGLDVNLRADTKIEAKLSDEIKKYEEELEAAAKEYGFEAYVELFKALAEQRHYDGKKGDIFNMSKTSLNPDPKKTLSRADSIKIAAELFADCIDAYSKMGEPHMPPQPTDTEALKSILQAFEFESDGFVDYCEGKYTLEKAEEYAKKKSGNTKRTDEAEIQQKGPWDFKDQKYPDKVLQFYFVQVSQTGGGGSFGFSLPSEALSDKEFMNMYNEISKYVQGNYPYVFGGSSPETSFDCSGFVCWVINHCGNGWNVDRTTANGLLSYCAEVKKEDAKPGDLIFFQGTYAEPGASHVGIVVGNNHFAHFGNPGKISDYTESYWVEHFLAIGRLNMKSATSAKSSD